MKKYIVVIAAFILWSVICFDISAILNTTLAMTQMQHSSNLFYFAMERWDLISIIGYVAICFVFYKIIKKEN